MVIGRDDTIERRRSQRIAARGIYWDLVRSSKEFFVKTSGLCWVSLQLLVAIPCLRRRLAVARAERGWALPFLTMLAPSEHYHQGRGRWHKSLTDGGRQALVQVRRWLPDRLVVAVADRSYAVLDLLSAGT